MHPAIWQLAQHNRLTTPLEYIYLMIFRNYVGLSDICLAQ